MAHNSLGRTKNTISSDYTKPKRATLEEDDAYKLDGLQPGPICVGSYKPEVEEEMNNQSALDIEESGPR